MTGTGDLSFCVVTEYADAQIAGTAQGGTGDVRKQAATDLPMTMASAYGGSILNHG
ncbi:MAG: hypothetical protein WBN88_05595 [Anderseniella sp.]